MLHLSISLCGCYRKVNGLYQFQCHLKIDKDVIKEKDGLAYKYCVINSEYEDVFEYLHGLSIPKTGHRNRWLKINKGKNNDSIH